MSLLIEKCNSAIRLGIDCDELVKITNAKSSDIESIDNSLKIFLNKRIRKKLNLYTESGFILNNSIHIDNISYGSFINESLNADLSFNCFYRYDILKVVDILFSVLIKNKGEVGFVCEYKIDDNNKIMCLIPRDNIACSTYNSMNLGDYVNVKCRLHIISNGNMVIICDLHDKIL